jgi:hypothetical protein
VNRELSVVNLKENTFFAKRIIIDHVTSVGGIFGVTLDKDALAPVASARVKFDHYLKEERKKQLDEAKAQKRKLFTDKIDVFKTKKKRLEETAASLSKSADELALKAENARTGKAH